MTTLTVRAGPFSVFFTNVNSAMKLKGHSHFATVDLHFMSEDGEHSLGFPSFADTHAAIQQSLIEFFTPILRDYTNERIARELFWHMDAFKSPAIEKWGIKYALARLDLNVRGVPDAVGHADSFTTYTVER
jgi:hypothetical protein